MKMANESWALTPGAISILMGCIGAQRPSSFSPVVQILQLTQEALGNPESFRKWDSRLVGVVSDGGHYHSLAFRPELSARLRDKELWCIKIREFRASNGTIVVDSVNLLRCRTKIGDPLPIEQSYAKISLGSLDGFEAGPQDGTVKDGGSGAQIPIWRLDPEETFSDWTINVTSVYPAEVANCDGAGSSMAGHASEERLTSEKLSREACKQLRLSPEDGELKRTTRSYHLHRAIIASGSRKSLYFDRVVRTCGLAETQTRVSNIELDKPIADAVPLMLDFMYSDTREVVVRNDENALALRQLSRYFWIPALLESVNRHIRSRLLTCGVAAGSILREAIKFQDEDVLVQECTRQFAIRKSSGFPNKFDEIPADHVVRIVNSNQFCPLTETCRSKALGELVRYCQTHCDGCYINLDALEGMFPYQKFPRFSVGTSLSLIEIMSKIEEHHEVHCLALDSGGSEAALKLKSRCIQVVVAAWLKGKIPAGDDCTFGLGRLSPSTRSTLAKAMKLAGADRKRWPQTKITGHFRRANQSSSCNKHS